MRGMNKVVASLLLGVFALSSPAWGAQRHVADPSAMHRAIAEKVAQDDARRALVLRVLDRAAVREMAAGMKLNVEQARAAVATLDGAELAELAVQADAVETTMAGGASYVVISVTTLLLLLILIVLIAS